MEMITSSDRFKGSQDQADCEGNPESDEDSSLISAPTDPSINSKQAAQPLVSTFTTISADMSIEMRHRLPDFAIVLYQCLIAVVLVEFARLVGMLCSGFISLVYVSVPMVTIFKNLSNLVTVFGDWYLFGEKVSWVCIIAILVMTVGAILSAANDLEFNLYGYFWICLNCIFTSTYVLYMRYASTNIKLPRFGMVYYNNLLSAAILLPICIFHGDFKALGDTEIMTSSFILSNTMAGLIGFYLNFASLWCVSSTSATTYAIVGSLNKVPITIMGFVLFNAKMTSQGILYVTLATIGGFIYAFAKLPQNK
eukprot:gene32976-42670_t